MKFTWDGVGVELEPQQPSSAFVLCEKKKKKKKKKKKGRGQCNWAKIWMVT